MEEPQLLHGGSQAAGDGFQQRLALALQAAGRREVKAQAGNQVGDAAKKKRVRNYMAWTGGISRRGEKWKEIGLFLKIEMTEFSD